MNDTVAQFSPHLRFILNDNDITNFHKNVFHHRIVFLEGFLSSEAMISLYLILSLVCMPAITNSLLVAHWRPTTQ